MLSSIRSIYNQTFAAPGHVLLNKSLGLQPESLEEDLRKDNKMLLIHPRERSRATFDNDHAISHPASRQVTVQNASPNAQAFLSVADSPIMSTTRATSSSIFKPEVAALSLEQLYELSTLVSDRIQIKKRYNNTPLRRIIARQVSSNAFQDAFRPDLDPASQTDALVNIKTSEIAREPVEVRRARYNSTPLRRILSRQTSTEQRNNASPSAPARAHYEREPLEVRRARYNNTPLRRILSRQTSLEQIEAPVGSGVLPLPTRATSPSQSPVPRSNTPLRRILSRQASAQIVLKKDDDELSDRADSVIDPDSRRCSRAAAPTVAVALHDESHIRDYETALWNLTKPNTSCSTAAAAKTHLTSASEVRAYHEELSANPTFPGLRIEKEKSSVVMVTEISAEAKEPKRIVVDSKGSPLRRILQRQTSQDWRAVARVGVV